jgi:hypothetical protein
MAPSMRARTGPFSLAAIRCTCFVPAQPVRRHTCAAFQSKAIHRAGPRMAPPRFYKLEFTTYDGTEDPLN